MLHAGANPKSVQVVHRTAWPTKQHYHTLLLNYAMSSWKIVVFISFIVLYTVFSCQMIERKSQFKFRIGLSKSQKQPWLHGCPFWPWKCFPLIALQGNFVLFDQGSMELLDVRRNNNNKETKELAIWWWKTLVLEPWFSPPCLHM